MMASGVPIVASDVTTHPWLVGEAGLIAEAENPREVLEELADSRNALYEEIADIVVRTDEQSTKVVIDEIIEKIGL